MHGLSAISKKVFFKLGIDLLHILYITLYSNIFLFFWVRKGEEETTRYVPEIKGYRTSWMLSVSSCNFVPTMKFLHLNTSFQIIHGSF